MHHRSTPDHEPTLVMTSLFSAKPNHQLKPNRSYTLHILSLYQQPKYPSTHYRTSSF